MQAIIKSLLLIVMLVSCGGKDSRYRDTQMLERPPTLAIEKHAGEQAIEPDESMIAKKPVSEGLGSDISMTESRPMQLKIKRPFDDAWRYVGLALKQSQIRVIDHEQEKGLYYVYYREKNLVESAVSLFQKEQEDGAHEANYVLTLKEDGAVTKVTVTPVNPPEQDAFDDEDVDTSEQEGLLWDLYETLKNKLIEE